MKQRIVPYSEEELQWAEGMAWSIRRLVLCEETPNAMNVYGLRATEGKRKKSYARALEDERRRVASVFESMLAQAFEENGRDSMPTQFHLARLLQATRDVLLHMVETDQFSSRYPVSSAETARERHQRRSRLARAYLAQLIKPGRGSPRTKECRDFLAEKKLLFGETKVRKLRADLGMKKGRRGRPRS